MGPSLTLAIIVHINIIDNDDNGTVRHHLSNLNGTYEQYIDRCINHRHRAYCCINYVLVFALFKIILLLLLAYTGTRPIIDQIICTDVNGQNLVNFQSIKLKLGSVFISIERTIRFDHCIVPLFPATVLKKSVYVWKKCLVKHDLNCTVQ